LHNVAQHWVANENLIEQGAEIEADTNGPKWKPDLNDEQSMGEFFAERDLARDVHDRIMIPMHRYSCVVMLFITVERELRRLIENLEKERGPQKLKVNDIREKSYMAQVGKFVAVFYGVKFSDCPQYTSLSDFDRVVLCGDGSEVARHARIWEAEQVCFEPLHYLALLETKPGALDHARPLAGWTLPECFLLLRRRLEAERDGDGTREYIKVLRLLENHPLPKLRAAVEAALEVGALTRDAVAQFLYPREDWRATRFSLDGHPHLRHVRVAAPNLASYMDLVGGVA
jgi:hypothetical protein